ncbi:acetyltransferase [Fusobacterium animalis ATCC 51191]|uniref:Acetyltransferase n=1 Tax=Fusobacterium animalis ATCC 51191 TaxID=997347 RepID=F9EP09_9FUSO|nr:acetyltransferase [Fusobacterium animalis ATCC 51191]
MDVIKLISVNNDGLKNEALNIYLKNDYYFSKISDNLPSISTVEEDIEAIPNGVQKNQKNYRLISFNNEIFGLVDYLTDYPEKDIILIGFFIIKSDKQKQGLGTKIFRYLEKLFKNKKFLKIRIGVLVDNEIGLSFWKNKTLKKLKESF